MQLSLAELKETSRRRTNFLAMLGTSQGTARVDLKRDGTCSTAPCRAAADWRLAPRRDREAASQPRAHWSTTCSTSAAPSPARFSLERQPLDLHLAVDQALGALRAAGKTARRHVDYQGSSVWVGAPIVLASSRS